MRIWYAPVRRLREFHRISSRRFAGQVVRLVQVMPFRASRSACIAGSRTVATGSAPGPGLHPRGQDYASRADGRRHCGRDCLLHSGILSPGAFALRDVSGRKVLQSGRRARNSAGAFSPLSHAEQAWSLYLGPVGSCGRRRVPVGVALVARWRCLRRGCCVPAAAACLPHRRRVRGRPLVTGIPLRSAGLAARPG